MSVDSSLVVGPERGDALRKRTVPPQAAARRGNIRRWPGLPRRWRFRVRYALAACLVNEPIEAAAAALAMVFKLVEFALSRCLARIQFRRLLIDGCLTEAGLMITTRTPT
jgi:hypothetical protein